MGCLGEDGTGPHPFQPARGTVRIGVMQSGLPKRSEKAIEKAQE
jgi:hypothetical protein